MKRLQSIVRFIFLSAISTVCFAEDIYTEFFSDKAVSGYDTVSFFTEGKPVKGKKNLLLSILIASGISVQRKTKRYLKKTLISIARNSVVIVHGPLPQIMRRHPGM